MAYWAKKTAREIAQRITQVKVAAFRVAHIDERKVDQKAAVTQLAHHRRKLTRAA
jgi:hypothetical protein